MATLKLRTVRLPLRSSRRRFERSTRIDTLVWCSWSASEDFTQATAPFGRAVLVTPSQSPRVVATARAVRLPNSVDEATRATTRPFGFARRATVRPALRAAIEKDG